MATLQQIGGIYYLRFRFGGNTRPFVGFVGSYKGQPFVFQLNLEPIPDTEPLELLDTIQDIVRPYNGETA